MHRIIWSMAILCVSTGSVRSAEEYTFLNLESGLNIELQPSDDYHRIHFRVRMEGLAGKTGFARIAVSRDVNGADIHSETTEIFRVQQPREEWEFHLRVPRFSSRTAVYTLVLGHIDAKEIDQYRSQVGYRWIIDRDRSGTAITRTEENGRVFPVTFTFRSAVVVGGEIRIVHAPIVSRREGIRFAEFPSAGAVDGAQSARRLN